MHRVWRLNGGGFWRRSGANSVLGSPMRRANVRLMGDALAPLASLRNLHIVVRSNGQTGKPARRLGFESPGSLPVDCRAQCSSHPCGQHGQTPDLQLHRWPRMFAVRGQQRSQGGVKFPTGGDGLHAGTSPRAPAQPSWRCGVSRPGVTPGPTVWRRLLVQGAAHSPDERERGPMPWPAACACVHAVGMAWRAPHALIHETHTSW